MLFDSGVRSGADVIIAVDGYPTLADLAPEALRPVS